MEGFVALLGKNGLIGFIGIIIFLMSFRYSKDLFAWIENQTMGTRTYILDKCELLHIKIDPDKLTIWLLAISCGSGAVVFILLGLLGQWIAGVFAGLFVSYLGFKLPKLVINFLIQKRIKDYQNQMVDGLQLLSNGIRAGLSVPQAIGMVVNELKAPISQEFNTMLQQNKIGVPLEECLDNLVSRIPTQDNQMFVSSVNILRETGGNLAEVFDTIVDVIRERIRLQQKVDTYTAQGMFQGLTIGAMPFLMFMVFLSSNPDSMINFMTHPVGIALIIVALVLDGFGLFVIMKIVKIKI